MRVGALYLYIVLGYWCLISFTLDNKHNLTVLDNKHKIEICAGARRICICICASAPAGAVPKEHGHRETDAGVSGCPRTG